MGFDLAERKPITGLAGYDVDRSGKIYPSGVDQPLDRDGLYTTVETPLGAAAVQGSNIAADIFLKSSERLDLFQRFADRFDVKSRAAKDAAKEYGVSEWVIRACTLLGDPGAELRKLLASLAAGNAEDLQRIGTFEKVAFEDYGGPHLEEKHRSPSRGGNTKALHSHSVVIDGKRYFWKALGAKKWAFKGDLVSFRYVELDFGGAVLKHTFRAFDRDGVEVVRGIRDWKPSLRTASQRPPASRREQRD